MSRAEDDSFGERARAKRASNAGEGVRRGRGADSALPEKKRARRRLVGAIALALGAAVGLPMLLDSEPKPLSGDIAIEIPAKDKAAPLPVPLDPAAKQGAVPAAETVDKGEEIVEPSRPAPVRKAGDAPKAADTRAIAEVRTAPAKPAASLPETAPWQEPAKVERVKPEPKQELLPKPEHKAPPKPEPKPAEKPAQKPASRSEDKHVAGEDSARAMAILEGKPAEKPHEAAGEKVTLQVAALGSAEKAAELQARLTAAGIPSFTQKLARPGGDLIRVKVGPLSHDEAEKVRAKLGKLGL